MLAGRRSENDPPEAASGPGAGGGGTGGSPLPDGERRPEAATRRGSIRHALGWAAWPFYVWRRSTDIWPADPGVIRSILHTGYTFTALSAGIDGFLWAHPGVPGGALFLLLHMVWVSGITSLLLLNPRFLERLDGRPLERLGWANWLTAARVFLLPVLVHLLLNQLWTPALIGYVILGLTDVADGAVARHRQEESKLGFVLDPFVDILFHLGILLSLGWGGILSGITTSLVILRYGLLLSGCALLFFWRGEIWIQPTPFGKATGLLISGLTGLLILILGISGPAADPVLWIDRILAGLFGATTIHVLVIGWNNFRRPVQGGTAVYRRGWGLQLGHSERPGAAPEGSREEAVGDRIDDPQTTRRPGDSPTNLHPPEPDGGGRHDDGTGR